MPIPTVDQLVTRSISPDIPAVAQALAATGSTITPYEGVTRLSAAAAVTASTLAAGPAPYECTLINESANSVAVTAGVSPASVTIAAGAAARFVWDSQAATPAWYHLA